MLNPELLIKKEQLCGQIRNIISREGDAWFDIITQENLVRDAFLESVRNNDDLETLITAKEYAQVLIQKQIIHEQLKDKYSALSDLMQSIDRQIRSSS